MMLKENLVFILGLGLFAAAAVRLAYKGAAFSPQFIAALTLIFSGVLALVPQMIYSANRDDEMDIRTQIFILLGAATFLAAAFFTQRPRLRHGYRPFRWKFLPRRGWLLVFCAFCLADPMVSFLLFGKVGLMQGNEGMGSGGGGQSEVFTPLTFIAWSCSSMAMAMLTTDFLFSFTGFFPYVKRRALDVLLVLVCLFSATLSGNRFVLISQLLSLLLGLALFSRLKVWMGAAAAVFLAVFFVVVGNFRFGKVDITIILERTTGVNSIDMLRAWVASYLEPIFANLDNFIRDQPEITWGLDWVTSVVPRGVIDALDLSRTNASRWYTENSLDAYHGLTFRTMYPDLIMDFGYGGALAVGTMFFILGVRVYNSSLRSAFHFLLFLAYSPLILLMPLIAGFYSLPNLITFSILLLVGERRSLVRGSKSFPRIEVAARTGRAASIGHVGIAASGFLWRHKYFTRLRTSSAGKQINLQADASISPGREIES